VLSASLETAAWYDAMPAVRSGYAGEGVRDNEHLARGKNETWRCDCPLHLVIEPAWSRSLAFTSLPVCAYSVCPLPFPPPSLFSICPMPRLWRSPLLLACIR